MGFEQVLLGLLGHVYCNGVMDRLWIPSETVTHASASTATDAGVPAKQTRMLPMVNPNWRRPTQ